MPATPGLTALGGAARITRVPEETLGKPKTPHFGVVIEFVEGPSGFARASSPLPRETPELLGDGPSLPILVLP